MIDAFLASIPLNLAFSGIKQVNSFATGNSQQDHFNG
jgi:hypothetical protein